MSYRYSYETFSAASDRFDHEFSGYLNDKGSKNWRVMHCNYCHGTDDDRMHAACMFERQE
jgi:hypothetical protein